MLPSQSVYSSYFSWAFMTCIDLFLVKTLVTGKWLPTSKHTHTHTHKGQMFILELEDSLEIILSTPLDRWGKWDIGRGCELLKDLQVANSGPRLPVYCSQSMDFVFRKVKVLNLVLLFTMWWSPRCVYSSACFPIYKIGVTFSDVGTKYDYALWNTPKWLGDYCSLSSSSFLLW